MVNARVSAYIYAFAFPRVDDALAAGSACGGPSARMRADMESAPAPAARSPSSTIGTVDVTQQIGSTAGWRHELHWIEAQVR